LRSAPRLVAAGPRYLAQSRHLPPPNPIS